jgi:hypothetical protein
MTLSPLSAVLAAMAVPECASDELNDFHSIACVGLLALDQRFAYICAIASNLAVNSGNFRHSASTL